VNTATGVIAHLTGPATISDDPAVAWLEDPKNLLSALAHDIEHRPDCWSAPMIRLKNDLNPCCQDADDDHDQDPDAWLEFSYAVSTTTTADYNDPGRRWL
jgi:hypothetical protein